MAGKMGSLGERLLSNRGYSELGFSPVEMTNDWNVSCRSYHGAGETVARWRKNLERVASKAYDMGKSDPRKIVFSAKISLALMLILVVDILERALQL